MAEAVIGTNTQVAVDTRVSWVTGTHSIVTMHVLGTSLGTASQRAIGSHPSTITNAHEINTCTMLAAIARALAV